MTEPTPSSAFISYARSDAELAERVSELLSRAGVRPWLDKDEIRPGERWRERIEDALRSTRVLVVLVTPESARSPWIFFELGVAIADGKTIIPVLSEDMRPEDMPEALRAYQWVQVDASVGKRIAAALVPGASSAESTRPH